MPARTLANVISAFAGIRARQRTSETLTAAVAAWPHTMREVLLPQ